MQQPLPVFLPCPASDPSYCPGDHGGLRATEAAHPIGGHTDPWPGLFLYHLCFHFPLFSVQLLFGHFSPLSRAERGKRGAFALSELELGPVLCPGLGGVEDHEDPLSPTVPSPWCTGARRPWAGVGGPDTQRLEAPRVWGAGDDGGQAQNLRRMRTGTLMPTALWHRGPIYLPSPPSPHTEPSGCFVFCVLVFLALFSSCP